MHITEFHQLLYVHYGHELFPLYTQRLVKLQQQCRRDLHLSKDVPLSSTILRRTIRQAVKDMESENATGLQTPFFEACLENTEFQESLADQRIQNPKPEGSEEVQKQHSSKTNTVAPLKQLSRRLRQRIRAQLEVKIATKQAVYYPRCTKTECLACKHLASNHPVSVCSAVHTGTRCIPVGLFPHIRKRLFKTLHQRAEEGTLPEFTIELGRFKNPLLGIHPLTKTNTAKPKKVTTSSKKVVESEKSTPPAKTKLGQSRPVLEKPRLLPAKRHLEASCCSSGTRNLTKHQMVDSHRVHTIRKRYPTFHASKISAIIAHIDRGRDQSQALKKLNDLQAIQLLELEDKYDSDEVDVTDD